MTIISHKHKFIFVKNPKIAGTSIEVALSEYLGRQDVLSPLLDPYDRKRIRESNIYLSPQNFVYSSKVNHLVAFPRLIYRTLRPGVISQLFVESESATYLRSILGKKIFDNYYKFCFERNPYDKVASSYYYSLSFAKNPMPFKDYMEKRGYIANNWHLYTDNNKIIVDNVYRFENLPDEINKLSDDLGLKIKLPEFKFKGNSRKKGESYRDLIKLNSPEKQRIDKVFENELNAFNYNY